jgi:hypothetical protein
MAKIARLVLGVAVEVIGDPEYGDRSMPYSVVPQMILKCEDELKGLSVFDNFLDMPRSIVAERRRVPKFKRRQGRVVSQFEISGQVEGDSGGL